MKKPIISSFSELPDLSKETQESINTRVQNCIKEVEEVLRKHHCSLQVQQGVTIQPLQIQ